MITGKAAQALDEPGKRFVMEAQALAAANPDITTASFNLRAARDNVDVAFAGEILHVDSGYHAMGAPHLDTFK